MSRLLSFIVVHEVIEVIGRKLRIWVICFLTDYNLFAT